ncbi:MAG: gliding motility protein GldN [Muribaculaceae bacterium]|nr:gliding motility protein GldN [Muribaculaceae bacterium]
MKSLRLIIAVLLIGLTVGAYAQDANNTGGDSKAGSTGVTRGSRSGSNSSTPQVSRRSGNDRGKKDKKDGNALITDRQQSFYEVREPSDADLQWMKVIYRSIDLTKGKNPALYYPEEPNADGENLFFIIMRLLAKNQITAYEYLDGREMFTDEFKIKVDEMLDRFHIYYTEAKGSSAKNPIYEFENADIPSNEVLSYYIIEKWEFDTRSNQMKARVEALCPVLHRMDEWGGEAVRYPMFWVKLNDIRPYMAQQYVFTDDDNNLPRYSIDDFFKLNMYTGEIYKTKNLRNQSLRQLYPEDEAYKHAQDSIEQRLRSFNQDLWVPPLEVLQARAEAEEKARAEAEGELVEEGEEGAEQVEGEAAAEGAEEKTVTRTTKRGSKSSAAKDTKKAAKAKAKEKKAKIKERKPKSSTQTVNTGVRSVRNRKK